MPYKTNSDLLDSVRNALPTAAQTIFREVTTAPGISTKIPRSGVGTNRAKR